MIVGLLVVGAIALATLRRYSLAQTATITSLALFISTGLNSVSAAPSYSLGLTQTEIYTMQPWEQPCGTPLSSALKRKTPRHSVHRILKRVRTQLRVAQNHYRKNRIDVNKIYSKVCKVLKGQYHMSWLPKHQFDWYSNEVWCLEKSKKAEYALPKLHEALQRFAITFYSLRRFKLKSNINAERTVKRRNEIVSEIQNEVFRMLCEVETAILSLGFQLPSVHNAKIVTESPDWANGGDLTLMLIQDWGILRMYRKFLMDWTRAFRNATANGPGTCDPKSVIPLMNRPKKKNIKKSTHLKNKQMLNSRGKIRRQMKNDVAISNSNNNSNNNSDGGATHLRKKSKRKIIKNRQRKLQ